MTDKTIVLRDTRSRYLEASINAKGDLVIEGQDLGSEVEALFGFSEYEWAWTISARDCNKLFDALGAGSDLLTALSKSFSGNRASGLQSFLESEGIEFEAWGRIGD